MSQPLITIVGPTALGKSSVAVLLAQKIDGEIVSADSRQIYKELSIGSGKITPAEMQGIPHHMLDKVSVSGHFSVNDFVTQARQKIADIAARSKTPIIVGGTGLYIDATIRDMHFPEVEPNPALREELSARPTEELFAELEALDPERAQTIDKHNPHRLIRAIEIARQLGAVPSSSPLKAPYLYDVRQFGLIASLDFLREQITTRLDDRLAHGLIEEVQHILASGIASDHLESFGLEYRYVTQHVRGALSREDMREQLITKIFQYAKRQITWFKRNTDIIWFDREKMLAEEIARQIAEKIAA